MKTIGIIAEYNPFHNGHLHQLHMLRSLTGADYVITAISGDFVQRGKPAIYDKYTRTRMALLAGVDLVLELPVCFATGSAMDFASCGVALFDRLGIVDWLGFGSESGDCDLLFKAAYLLEKDPEEFAQTLQTLLRQGLSFPQARATAFRQYLSRTEPDLGDVTSLISSPNNILGIEYLRALIRRGSSIKPVTIRRIGQDYHGTDPVGRDTAASASAIRKAIREENSDMVSHQVPKAVSELLSSKCFGTPVFSDDLTALINSRILELSNPSRSVNRCPFEAYADMSLELAARLQRNVLNFATFTGRILQLKTRGYTYTRISRALLHLLLGITAEETSHYREKDYVCYARILGFRRQAAPLLSQLKQSSSLPLITKTARAHKVLDPDGLAMLQMDFHASHLYQSMVFAKTGQTMPNEYTQSVIVL
ncbi:MAG: nucleotidyltransferase family protein [Lachnospiraceae bacterium]|nr:nucleotidyltransferase family protein [Lachnospiraceae bacterium]